MTKLTRVDVANRLACLLWQITDKTQIIAPTDLAKTLRGMAFELDQKPEPTQLDAAGIAAKIFHLNGPCGKSVVQVSTPTCPGWTHTSGHITEWEKIHPNAAALRHRDALRRAVRETIEAAQKEV